MDAVSRSVTPAKIVERPQPINYKEYNKKWKIRTLSRRVSIAEIYNSLLNNEGISKNNAWHKNDERPDHERQNLARRSSRQWEIITERQNENGQ